MEAKDGSPKVYTELTPVLLENRDGERTEVKVPYTGTNDPPNNTSLLSVTPLNPFEASSRVTFASYIPDYVETECSNNQDVLTAVKAENEEGYESSNPDVEFCESDNNNVVYKSLQILFRGLPREMFINRILTDTASCEIKLGDMRQALFEQLKEAEDFPYGLQCMLKRRVYTRSGDSVPIKFAHDIHTLMSVIEGAEYSEMRELLSSGNGRSQKSQSCSSTANETINSYDFSAEIKVLTDSVNGLKADLLKMKQSQIATETSRSKQIETLKSTVLSMKSDLTALSGTVTRAVTNIKLCAERIESEKSLGVTNLKSEFRLMKDRLASLEDSVFNIQTRATFGWSAASQPGKASRKVKSCQLSGNLGRSGAGNSSSPSVAGSGQITDTELTNEGHSGETSVSIPDSGYTAEVLEQGSKQRLSTGFGEKSSYVPSTSGGETNIDELGESALVANFNTEREPMTENLPQQKARAESNTHINVQTPCETEKLSYRDVVASKTNQRNDTDIGGYIETRVTRSTGSSSHNTRDNIDMDEDEDFVQFVKKRVKRYYLGGFKPSITRQRIEHYVTKRGPTVTWVRIWNSKRRPDNVIIRLNVEDNDQARLLDSRSFWPKGVICRPWINGGNRYTSSKGDYNLSHSKQLARHIYGRSDIDEYNPYSPLRDSSNLD